MNWKKLFNRGKEAIRPKSLAELRMKANISLDKAEKEYRTVILMRLADLRYNKEHNISKNNELSYMLIKKAYYGIHLVNSTRNRMADMSSVEEFYKAMNDTTRAFRSINRYDSKSPNPHILGYRIASQKMDYTDAHSKEALHDLLTPIEDINQCVTDDLVEKLVNNAYLDDCIANYDGISIDPNEFAGLDLSDLAELQPSPDLADFEFVYDPEL